MKHEVGARIGALLSVDDEVVHFLGYGTYQGDQLPPDFPLPNPKLELDDGSIVWGYQCWWGPEDAVRSWLEAAGLRLELVTYA